MIKYIIWWTVDNGMGGWRMIRAVQLSDMVETKKQLQDTKQRINN